jgi:hypothetical protein
LKAKIRIYNFTPQSYSLIRYDPNGGITKKEGTLEAILI